MYITPIPLLTFSRGLKNRHGHPSASRRDPAQSGYALLMVMMVLLTLTVSATYMFQQTRDATQMSGNERDYQAAVRMAEGAMNTVMGGILGNASLDGDAVPDQNELGQKAQELQPDKMTAVGLAALPYAFFVRDGSSTTRVQSNDFKPHLLQLVANGEASSGDYSTASNQAVSNQRLRIGDLFIAGGARPLIYTPSSTGLSRSALAWNALGEPRQAVAVWLEYARNNADALDVYVQAAAQVGSAKAYTQRLLGQTNAISARNPNGPGVLALETVLAEAHHGN